MSKLLEEDFGINTMKNIDLRYAQDNFYTQTYSLIKKSTLLCMLYFLMN